MEKWADHLISAVQCNSADTHIVKVMSHVDNGDTVGGGTEVTRPSVVANLEKGTTYTTITRGRDGKWNKGAEITTVMIEGVIYIKTIADNSKKDNLGDLPRF